MRKYGRFGSLPKFLAAGVLLAINIIAASAVADNFETGYTAYQKGEFKVAAKEWLALAKEGHAKSQYNLGILFDQGKGVVQDRAEAVKWWLKAAENDFQLAQHNLANAYISGDGVEQNYGKAIEWLERASKFGIGIIARTPLIFGFLSGKFDVGIKFPAEDHRSTWSREQIVSWIENGREITEVMGNLTDCTPCQVALRFCLSFPSITTAVPGMIRPSEVSENIVAGSSGALLPQHLRIIMEMFQNQATYSGVRQNVNTK